MCDIYFLRETKIRRGRGKLGWADESKCENVDTQFMYQSSPSLLSQQPCFSSWIGLIAKLVRHQEDVSVQLCMYIK